MNNNISGPMTSPPRTKVWDIFVRIFHWSIVTGFILEMFLTDEGKFLHRWTGYVILSLIALRIIWGFIGSHHARFKDFFPTPTRLKEYINLLAQGREPRYIGHNPAGALMMFALIFAMIGCCITGWMQGLDAFWGDEWLEETHEVLANSILVMAIFHVLGAIVESFRHHENLIWSMITGYKRPPENDDIVQP